MSNIERFFLNRWGKDTHSTAVTAILDINAWPGTKWSFLNIAMLIEMMSKDGKLVE